MRARERAGIWLFSLHRGRPSAEGGTPRPVVFKRVDDFHDYLYTTIYLVLSYNQRQTPDLIERLRSIGRPGTHPLLHWTGAFHFTRACKWSVMAAIIVWLLNMCLNTLNARTLVNATFGVSDNIFFIILVAYSNFHILLLCWFVPVPIIFIGYYFLSSKVKTIMYKVFENEFAKCGDINLVSLTELYMEIYELNRSLNSCLSFLFTFVTGTMSFVFLFVIMVSEDDV